MREHDAQCMRVRAFCGLLIIGALLNGGCGGGFPPKEFWSAAVESQEGGIQKRLIYQSSDIGLIRCMFQGSSSNEIAVVGYDGNCLLSFSKEAVIAKRITNYAPVPPVNLHGSFMSNGYIEVDFDGDGIFERIRPCAEDGYKLENISGSEIARTHLDTDFWYKPEVTISPPHLLLVSTDGYLLIFDKTMRIVRRLPLLGIHAPIHIMGGASLTGSRKGLFVSIFGGRGGWHRSVLLVHSSDDRVIYKEVLIGDFEAVWSLGESNGMYRFLLGGRGEIFEYMIPIEPPGKTHEDGKSVVTLREK